MFGHVFLSYSVWILKIVNFIMSIQINAYDIIFINTDLIFNITFDPIQSFHFNHHSTINISHIHINQNRIIIIISKCSPSQMNYNKISTRFTSLKKYLENLIKIEWKIPTCFNCSVGMSMGLISIRSKRIKNLSKLIRPISIWLAKIHGKVRVKRILLIIMNTASMPIQKFFIGLKII